MRIAFRLYFFNNICSGHWGKFLIFVCHLRESDIYSNYFKYTRPFTNDMYAKVDGSQKDLNDIMKNPGKLPWVDKAEKNIYGPTRRGANPTPNFIDRNQIMGR